MSRLNDGNSRCETPTSSVLFDGNIPTLNGLNGNMWASQLLALQIHNRSGIEIISDFTGRFGVERVELTIEWGTAVQVVGICHINIKHQNIHIPSLPVTRWRECAYPHLPSLNTL